MKVAAFIFLLSSVVYARPELHLKNGKEIEPDKYIQNLLSLKEDKVKLAKIAFELSKEMYRSVNVKKDMKVIKSLASAVRKEAKNSLDPDKRIATLNKILFFQSEFRYDFSDPTAQQPENNLLSLTLKTHKGSCLTMPLLYIAVAQELDWPIYPVVVQNHIFLRYVTPDGGEINIEATSGGGSYSDSWYAKRFEVSDQAIKNGTYMKTNSYKEMVGILLQYNAVQYAKQRNHIKAFEYIDAAIELFPANPNLVMEKAKMLSDISEDFMKRGQLFDSDEIYGEAKKYANKARSLGFKVIDKNRYIKEMQEYKAQEDLKKRLPASM